MPTVGTGWSFCPLARRDHAATPSGPTRRAATARRARGSRKRARVGDARVDRHAAVAVARQHEPADARHAAVDRASRSRCPTVYCGMPAGWRNTRVKTGSMPSRIVVSQIRARPFDERLVIERHRGRIVGAADHDADERAARRRAARVDARVPERAEDPDAFAARDEETEAVERPVEAGRLVPEADDRQRRRGNRAQHAREVVVEAVHQRGAHRRAAREDHRVGLERRGRRPDRRSHPSGAAGPCGAAHGAPHSRSARAGPARGRGACTSSSMPPVNEVRCPPGAPIGAPEGARRSRRFASIAFTRLPCSRLHLPHLREARPQRELARVAAEDAGHHRVDQHVGRLAPDAARRQTRGSSRRRPGGARANGSPHDAQRGPRTTAGRLRAKPSGPPGSACRRPSPIDEPTLRPLVSAGSRRSRSRAAGRARASRARCRETRSGPTRTGTRRPARCRRFPPGRAARSSTVTSSRPLASRVSSNAIERPAMPPPGNRRRAASRASPHAGRCACTQRAARRSAAASRWRSTCRASDSMNSGCVFSASGRR